MVRPPPTSSPSFSTIHQETSHFNLIRAVAEPGDEGERSRLKRLFAGPFFGAQGLAAGVGPNADPIAAFLAVEGEAGVVTRP
jgi:hypothetical protein